MTRRRLVWPGVVVALLLLSTAAWMLVDRVRAVPPVHLVAALGAEFPVDLDGTGHLDLRAASAATVIPTSELAAELRRRGFRGGEARSWHVQDGFAEVAGFVLRDDAAARALVRYGVSYAEQLPGGGVHAGKAALFPVPSVKGAQGFVANGVTSSSGDPLFVHGVWFARGSIAYLVETGSPRPEAQDGAVDLAQRQDRAAG